MLDPRFIVRTVAGGPFTREPVVGQAVYPWAGDPRLSRLRERFGLARVVEGCTTDLARFVALREWVRTSLYRHGWSFSRLETTPRGAEAILDEAGRGTFFNCSFHAEVIRDCAAALGYPSRIAGLAMMGQEFPRDRAGNIGHTIAEIWSGDLQKWVAMDADANVHYERGGTPMSSAEVCERWHADQCADVVAVYGRSRPHFDDRADERGAVAGISWSVEDVHVQEGHFLRHNVKDMYQLVGVVESVNGQDIFVVYLPPGVMPPLVMDSAAYNFHPDVFTRDPLLIDHHPWQVVLHVDDIQTVNGAGSMLISLSVDMPGFSHYLTRVDDGREVQMTGSTFRLSLSPGRHRVEIVPVNERGVKGGAAGIAVEMTESSQVAGGSGNRGVQK